MLVHTVIFWLKDGLSEEEKNNFKAGVETLAKINSTESVYVGSPSATAERPVIDKSYTVMLTVVLKDIASHDLYQDDPIHHSFIENFSTYWEKVQIYDAD